MYTERHKQKFKKPNDVITIVLKMFTIVTEILLYVITKSNFE